jgi:predicted aspartyl protease
MLNMIRILGALALLLPNLSQAADDAAGCRYVPAGKLELAFSGQSPQAFVSSTINGKPVRAILGTGSYTTFVTRGGADRLGLSFQPNGRYSIGVGGYSMMSVAKVDDFSLGASHTGKTQLLVNGSGTDPDVIVGADLLLQNDMELSLAEKYVRFFKASNCSGSFLAYWDREAMALPFTGIQAASNKPIFSVELNGVKLKAMLDTGSARSSVTRDGAKRAGIGFDDPGLRHGDHIVGFGNDTLATRLATFDSFKIGTETIQHADLVVINFSPAASSDVDVVLGADFLRAHRVLFAMSQNRLYMSYVGGKVFTSHPQRNNDQP